MPPAMVHARSKSSQNGAMRGGEMKGKFLGGQQLVKGESNDKMPLEFTCRE